MADQLVLEARQLLQQRRTDDAIALLEPALAGGSGSAEAHMLLGVALLQKGRREAGREHLETAADLEPGNAAVQFNLGQFYEKSGDADRAAGAYFAALEAQPQHAKAREALGRVDPEALQRFEQSHRPTPHAPPPPPPPARPAPEPERPSAGLASGYLGADDAEEDRAPNYLRGPDEDDAPIGPRLQEQETFVAATTHAKRPSRPWTVTMAIVVNWLWVAFTVLGVVYGQRTMSQAVTNPAAVFEQQLEQNGASMSPQQRAQLEAQIARIRQAQGSPEMGAVMRGASAGYIVGAIFGVLVVAGILALINSGLSNGASWAFWVQFVIYLIGVPSNLLQTQIPLNPFVPLNGVFALLCIVLLIVWWLPATREWFE